MGGKVKTATDATYAAGDAQFLTCTTDMQLVTKPYSIPELDFQFTGTFTASAASTTVKTSGAALRNHITGLKIANASDEGIVFKILDGTIPIYHDYIPPLTSPSPITFQTPLRGTSAQILNVAISGEVNHHGWTNGGNFYVSVQGFQAF